MSERPVFGLFQIHLSTAIFLMLVASLLTYPGITAFDEAFVFQNVSGSPDWCSPFDFFIYLAVCITILCFAGVVFEGHIRRREGRKP